MFDITGCCRLVALRKGLPLVSESTVKIPETRRITSDEPYKSDKQENDPAVSDRHSSRQSPFHGSELFRLASSAELWLRNAQ